MSDTVKAALIVSAAAITCCAMMIYFSRHQECLRIMGQVGNCVLGR